MVLFLNCVNDIVEWCANFDVCVGVVRYNVCVKQIDNDLESMGDWYNAR